MANRKDYELLFRLNAQMGGSYSSTFTRAQSEFTRLGNEIQKLGKLQGDISSYQKQQSAIESTRSKLENLQKQHDLLQKEINETNGSTTGLEREKAKLEQRIKDTETALGRQNQKLETTGARLKEASVDTGNLSQKDAELTTKIKQLQDEQSRAAESASSFGEKSAQAFGAIQQAIVASGIESALHDIADAYMECVTLASGFGESMSNVEALSGASAEELQQLSAMAKEMGAETKFTAKESADAFQYMALAGWNTESMLAGIEPVLNLASAANMDLATASDIVTDYLTAFGLTADDTAKFVDQMAYAMANSNTNVVQLGEAYKGCAATAKSMGYSVEDVTAVLMTMANAGVKGGEAGTALNAIMTRLATDTKGCASELAEYGVHVYDAQGNMQSLASILNGVSGIWETLTDAQQASLAKTISGTNHYSKLQTIMSGCSAAAERTGQSFNDYATALQNCTGSAGQMSSTMLNNLNGDLTLMNSALDAVKTTIGEEFNPELRRLTQFATETLGIINQFLQAHPALVKGAMSFVAVLGTATVGITAFSAAVKVAKALELATLFTGPTGVAIAAVAGVAALTAAVVGFVTAANEAIPSVSELTQAAQEMNETLNSAVTAYDDTTSSIMAASNLADNYINKLEAMGDASRLSVTEQQEYQNTLALLLQVMPDLSNCISQTTDAYGHTTYTLETNTKTLRSNTEEWKKNAMAQAYQEKLKAIYTAQADVLLEAEKNSVKLTQAENDLKLAEENRAKTVMRMNQIEQEAYSGNRNMRQEYDTLTASLAQYNTEIREAEGTIENLNVAMRNDEEAVAAAKEEVALAEEAVRSLTGVTEAQTQAETEAAAQTQGLQSVIAEATSQVAALTSTYNEAYAAALESVTGQYDLWDKAEKVVATSAGSINSALESQITYWDNYNQNLESLRERTADIEGLNEVIASFADGSADSVNAVAGMANATDTELAAMVQNWKTLQSAQKDVSQSLADLTTDFSNKMDELQQDLAKDIEEMDLGYEAAQSGRATIQGFIDGASSMLPQVQSAYARLAQTASNALSSKTIDIQKRELKGYASGTTAAARGFALVGEEGPELVYFGGGEKVLNAAQTAALQSRTAPAVQALFYPPQASGPVQVTIHVEGNATADTVQSLRDYGADFARQVLEVMEEADADMKRRTIW